MRLEFRPVRVAVEGQEDGRLVFSAEQLVAVLTLLARDHGEEGGRWFLEAGFDGLEGPEHPTFADLDEAEAWIEARLHTHLLGHGKHDAG